MNANWADIEPCDGPNRCHGCASWCDSCGDVDRICHDDSRQCMAHFCLGCGAGPTSISDYRCEGCRLTEDIEIAEAEMVRAAERGQDEREERWRKRLERALKEQGLVIT